MSKHYYIALTLSVVMTTISVGYFNKYYELRRENTRLKHEIIRMMADEDLKTHEHIQPETIQRQKDFHIVQ